MERSRMNRPDRSVSWRMALPIALSLLVIVAPLGGWPCVAPVSADPGTRYVAGVVGNDAGDCQDAALPCATIGYAISQAGEGDSVLITEGTYTENLKISGKTVTVRGGYTISGEQWLPQTGTTVVDGGQLGRTFEVHDGSDVVLEDMTITGGVAPEEACWGAGVQVTNARVTVRRAIVEGNQAICTSGESGGGAGGGLNAVFDEGPASLVVEDSYILHNQAGDHGSAVASDGGVTVLLTNVVIARNNRNVIAVSNSDLTLVNGTVADNGFDGNAILDFDSMASVTVLNSILWHSGSIACGGGTCDLTYSDIEGGWPGAGNIDANPGFVDAASGDYHLRAISPAIDQGTPAGAPAADIDGTPRDAAPDMGAYEWRGGFLTLLPLTFKNYGRDEIRGHWQFEVTGLLEAPLMADLYINGLEPDPDSPTGNDYLASGCMASPGGEGMAPLQLKATDRRDGSYDLSLLSTVIPPPSLGEPFIIQFLGQVVTHGPGVADDEAAGQVRSPWGEAAWTGSHLNRSTTECPPVGPDLEFRGDVYVHHGYAGPQVVGRTSLLEGHTNIVSLGMRVVWPDGTVVVVPYYTDLFSPQVDFVSEFRYLANYPGDPIGGQAYTFTLLDSQGNPIPGATATDLWTGCQTYPPPRDLTAARSVQDIDLSWTPVPDAPGFDPDGSGGAGQLGFYQIGVSPQFEGTTDYGANDIRGPNHRIPWLRHPDWNSSGSPDGVDYGYALSELEDGRYRLAVAAYSMADPADPAAGQGLECAVWDEPGTLFFDKSGETITFVTFGSISGQVLGEPGVPLANIAVDVEQGGYGACTDADGNYILWGLPLGTYNVVAGRDFCGPHPYDEVTITGVTLTEEVPDVTGIDFTLLEPG